MKYYKCGSVFPAANSTVNSTGCSSEFHVVLEHFEDLKNFILKRVDSFSQELTKTVIIASKRYFYFYFFV